MTYTLYHATDQSRVDSILEKGFICKANPEHWLGNGIYFYLDKDLAEWWATNPSSKFGVKIKTKSILRVTLECDDNKIIDLRNVDQYRDLIYQFHIFSRYASLRLEPDRKYNMQSYRCSFFDWVFNYTGVDCIIGCFDHEDKIYLQSLPPEAISGLKSFDLPFIETQVCIRQGVIATNTIEEVL